MRPDYMAIMFLCTGVMSFNAGMWQIFRRGQKQQLMENHENMSKPPLKELPGPNANANDCEFRRVELEGSFDNEGAALVGPRSIPSYKGAANEDESRGGFLVVSPFEVAGTKEFVMVNRGWIPVEAGKGRTFLAQYVGEGFTSSTVRGILRKEEFVSGSWFWGESPDNNGPVAEDLSWLAMRPYDMMRRYYGRRWGEKNIEDSVKAHGAHHYYVEMVEDFSGDDQRMVRGHAWPRRRDPDEIAYVHLTPIVHTMYVVFWWSVTIGSLYGVARCWRRQKDIFAARKRVNVQTIRLETQRQEEAQAYFQAMQDVEKLQQLTTVGGRAAAAAATAQLGGKDGSSKDDSDKK